MYSFGARFMGQISSIDCMSIAVPISHCLGYNYILSFEVGKYDFSTWSLSFKLVLSILTPLLLDMLSIFAEQPPGVLIGIALSL